MLQLEQLELAEKVFRVVEELVTQMKNQLWMKFTLNAQLADFTNTRFW
jgi:hypothetical protein